MNGFLDTNVIVRYLVREPADQAEEAVQIIDGDRILYVTPVILAETAYLLSSFYRAPRAAVVDNLIELVRKRNIVVAGLETSLVVTALLLCRPSGRVSFADAMLWAAARASGPGIVYSFDRRFPRDGIDVRSAPA